MRKKVLFIYPSSYDAKHNIIKSRKSFIPARVLPYLAGLTPQRYDISITDELVEPVDFNEDADLVALTGMLRHMPRALDIASEFHIRGKPVIIGGVGAFALQETMQKSGQFTSFIKGEADELWKVVLDDFEGGKLKKIYECERPVELNGLPAARFELLNDKKYMRSFWDRKHAIVPIETSRGCPHNCKFCLVTRYFGNKMRYRPVEEVVREIRRYGAKCIFFTDDNIAINPRRTIELLSAIKPLNIKWIAQFDSTAVEHPDVLRLAGESGCEAAVVGVESLNEANLYSINKLHNIKKDLNFLVKSFNNAGIPFVASIIFGFENDTPQSIDWTMEQMLKNEVDCVIPWILTPIPNTPFYDDCKAEGRIIHEDYSLYDHWHVVLRPKLMTPEELEKAYWKALRKFYSFPRIFGRIISSMDAADIPAILYHFYFRSQIGKNLHPICGHM